MVITIPQYEIVLVTGAWLLLYVITIAHRL